MYQHRVSRPEHFPEDQKGLWDSRTPANFWQQPLTFLLETPKLRFMISLPQGEPQSWAHHLSKLGHSTLATTDFFSWIWHNYMMTLCIVWLLRQLLSNPRQGQKPYQRTIHLTFVYGALTLSGTTHPHTINFALACPNSWRMNSPEFYLPPWRIWFILLFRLIDVYKGEKQSERTNNHFHALPMSNHMLLLFLVPS